MLTRHFQKNSRVNRQIIRINVDLGRAQTHCMEVYFYQIYDMIKANSIEERGGFRDRVKVALSFDSYQDLTVNGVKKADGFGKARRQHQYCNVFRFGRATREELQRTKLDVSLCF